MKGFRTILINVGLAIIPVLQETGAADLGLSDSSYSLYATIVAVINIVLRGFTTTPVGKSGK